MSLFMPSDCAIDGATPYWLLAATALLAIAALALLLQTVVLWRREARAHTVWWTRMPFVLPLLWAVLCGFLAQEAFANYHVVAFPPPCSGPGCGLLGLCFSVAAVGGETRLALLVTTLLLVLGWLALFRLAQRTQTTY
jgi:hypothetical protein